MQLGNATTPKARKPHVCFWCGELIVVGEKYSRWSWKDFGTIGTVKVHAECGAAWGQLKHPDNEEVHFADSHRGCCCENGRCECKKQETPDAE